MPYEYEHHSVRIIYLYMSTSIGAFALSICIYSCSFPLKFCGQHNSPQNNNAFFCNKRLMRHSVRTSIWQPISPLTSCRWSSRRLLAAGGARKRARCWRCACGLR